MTGNRHLTLVIGLLWFGQQTERCSASPRPRLDMMGLDEHAANEDDQENKDAGSSGNQENYFQKVDSTVEDESFRSLLDKFNVTDAAYGTVPTKDPIYNDYFRADSAYHRISSEDEEDIDLKSKKGKTTSFRKEHKKMEAVDQNEGGVRVQEKGLAKDDKQNRNAGDEKKIAGEKEKSQVGKIRLINEGKSSIEIELEKGRINSKKNLDKGWVKTTKIVPEYEQKKIEGINVKDYETSIEQDENQNKKGKTDKDLDSSDSNNEAEVYENVEEVTKENQGVTAKNEYKEDQTNNSLSTEQDEIKTADKDNVIIDNTEAVYKEEETSKIKKNEDFRDEILDTVEDGINKEAGLDTKEKIDSKEEVGDKNKEDKDIKEEINENETDDNNIKEGEISMEDHDNTDIKVIKDSSENDDKAGDDDIEELKSDTKDEVNTDKVINEKEENNNKDDDASNDIFKWTNTKFRDAPGVEFNEDTEEYDYKKMVKLLTTFVEKLNKPGKERLLVANFLNRAFMSEDVKIDLTMKNIVERVERNVIRDLYKFNGRRDDDVDDEEDDDGSLSLYDDYGDYNLGRAQDYELTNIFNVNKKRKRHRKYLTNRLSNSRLRQRQRIRCPPYNRRRGSHRPQIREKSRRVNLGENHVHWDNMYPDRSEENGDDYADEEAIAENGKKKTISLIVDEAPINNQTYIVKLISNNSESTDFDASKKKANDSKVLLDLSV